MLRIPAPHALRAFEAAALRLNFSLAAADLHLTPSAISQQIRTLEEELGIRLFRRLTRRLELTEEGKVLYHGVHNAFDTLRLTMTQLEHLRKSPRLRMSVLPSFASRWLARRLSNFARSVPEVQVTVLPLLELESFADDQVDVGLRWTSKSDWPGLSSVKIADETLFPVCSPQFLQKNQLGKSAEALLKSFLLGDIVFDDWRAWFRHNAIEVQALPISVYYDDASLRVEAAASGQGVALGRSFLVADDLAAGRLIQTHPVELAGDRSYYLVTPSSKFSSPLIQELIGWLHNEVANTYNILQGARDNSKFAH